MMLATGHGSSTTTQENLLGIPISRLDNPIFKQTDRTERNIMNGGRRNLCFSDYLKKLSVNRIFGLLVFKQTESLVFERQMWRFNTIDYILTFNIQVMYT